MMPSLRWTGGFAHNTHVLSRFCRPAVSRRLTALSPPSLLISFSSPLADPEQSPSGSSSPSSSFPFSLFCLLPTFDLFTAYSNFHGLLAPGVLLRSSAGLISSSSLSYSAPHHKLFTTTFRGQMCYDISHFTSVSVSVHLLMATSCDHQTFGLS